MTPRPRARAGAAVRRRPARRSVDSARGRRGRPRGRRERAARGAPLGDAAWWEAPATALGAGRGGAGGGEAAALARLIPPPCCALPRTRILAEFADRRLSLAAPTARAFARGAPRGRGDPRGRAAAADVRQAAPPPAAARAPTRALRRRSGSARRARRARARRPDGGADVHRRVVVARRGRDVRRAGEARGLVGRLVAGTRSRSPHEHEDVAFALHALTKLLRPLLLRLVGLRAARRAHREHRQPRRAWQRRRGGARRPPPRARAGHGEGGGGGGGGGDEAPPPLEPLVPIYTLVVTLQDVHDDASAARARATSAAARARSAGRGARWRPTTSAAPPRSTRASRRAACPDVALRTRALSPFHAAARDGAGAAGSGAAVREGSVFVYDASSSHRADGARAARAEGASDVAAVTLRLTFVGRARRPTRRARVVVALDPRRRRRRRCRAGTTGVRSRSRSRPARVEAQAY